MFISCQYGDEMIDSFTWNAKNNQSMNNSIIRMTLYLLFLLSRRCKSIVWCTVFHQTTTTTTIPTHLNMPLPRSAREAVANDRECGDLFSLEDPEKLFVDLREIGHGNFGAVYYVSSEAETSVFTGTSSSFRLGIQRRMKSSRSRKCRLDESKTPRFVQSIPMKYHIVFYSISFC
jgi:hypothetical protein